MTHKIVDDGTAESAKLMTEIGDMEKAVYGFTGDHKKPVIVWSVQQEDFLRWCEEGEGSCVLIAVAGAGKTTVLIEGGRRIAGGVAYVAYNRDIVNETKEKLAELKVDWKKMQANTAHGFGLAAVRKALPRIRIDEYKVRNMIDVGVPDEHFLAPHRETIEKLVSLAKQKAFGVLCSIDSEDEWWEMAEHYDIFDAEDGPVPEEEIIKAARKFLRASNAKMDTIDFDDMVYFPLIHKLRIWQHDVVMIDEAQDTNAARRALVRAMLKRGGRLVAVGDPHQAIYGFTGADADSLDLIARDFSCERLNLTITYRCPKAVVSFARKWVSHITAAETAPVGSIASVKEADFVDRNDLSGGSAVLCRNKKPLVSLAFALVRRRVPCRIEGREIGKSLQRLMTRWKVTSLDVLEERLEKYLAAETTKLLAKKQESKLEVVEDAVETVRVIVDQCRKEGKRTVADAVAYVDQLFGDKVKDVLVLSTIHKSKGREWQRVFWLDRAGTCPSKWARQEWQREQEKNLCYVAATRSKDQLIEIIVPPKKRVER